MHFAIVGTIERVDMIAVGGRIREIMRLRKQFGSGRSRELKGVAMVRIENGSFRRAELHW